ncbi:3'-5' exonuclease [Pseudomonas sp. A6]|uniref:3'-5' exonuclease n=1 Tax=Pseudomonas sp. A6 TaxID=410021 RepID=UPI00402510E2
MTNLAILDLETSGINPNKHSVLEIGLVPLDDKIEPFHAYIKSKNIIWSEYAKDNFKKFSSEWEINAISPEKAVRNLSQYIKNNFSNKKITLIGHNIGFDISFLKKLAFDANLDEIPGISHRAVDTHTLLYILNSQGKIPDSALTSDGAFDHFGVTPPSKLRHTALGDAIATQKLFKNILKLLDVNQIK